MSISTFYTLFWIIYFPTCIAYNDLPGFSSVDEVMTVILMAFTLTKKGVRSTNNKPWREYFMFLGILAFYIVYSLVFGVNVRGAVWLDMVQQIRPYSVIYCTWILAPRFSRTQRRMMLFTMIITLASWIVYHPSTIQSQEAEFPVLGQLAICCGMAWYLLTKESPRNRWIALALVCCGLLAPKMKFIGEVVCFVGMMFFVKKRLNFRSPRTIVILSVLVALCVFFTWSKFEGYYVSGWNNEALARPMSYKTSLKLLVDYFPFGPGMGSFATNAAWKYYSPIYPMYNLDHVWGLTPHDGFFICDAFYPTLAQFGIVGVILFFIFWKRRLREIVRIPDMRCYRVAMIAFFCLAIESTADSSYLSGKGMGYFMLLALCLNYKKLLAPLGPPCRGKRKIQQND